MVAPIHGPTSVSPVRTSAPGSEKPSTKKPQPGDIPFTRSGVPKNEEPGGRTNTFDVHMPVKVDDNGVPSKVAYGQGSRKVWIQRASEMEQPATRSNDVEPSGKENAPPV
ncbi:MAG: hypothetical protein ACRYGA_14850 [Janthinobacterium lividum]